MCRPRLPLEEFKGSWRDQNSSDFGKNTHSTHGKWKGINLSTTTQIQLFVSPLALNKEGRGRSCSGSPLLALLVWHAWGLATTITGFHLSYLASVIGNDPLESWRKHYRSALPWVEPGSGQARGAHKPLEWDSEPRCPKMAELWALMTWCPWTWGLSLLQAAPVWHEHLNQVSQDFIFWKS